MKWAAYSPALTREAREKKQLLDKRSKIGLRRDGSIFLKLRGIDMTVQRERVIERDGPYCRNCKQFLTPFEMEVDHILSRGKGGDDSMENLQLLGGAFSNCACHTRKHVRVLSGKVGT